MIKIKTSLLESVRQNPQAYGQLIATGSGDTSRGSHGMFQCFCEVARAVHIGTLTMREAVSALHNKFLAFADTPANKARQERLTEQLIAHLRTYRKAGYQWVDGTRRMQWPITKHVLLTGNTPWVVESDDNYVSFLLAERSFDWKQQLRFPLFQQYLSTTSIVCPPTSMTVGYYFADTDTFDLVSFGKSELKLAVDETGKLLTTVYQEYERKKRTGK